jgi:hypothetical protein
MEPFPPLDLLEMCATERLPFIIIVQCNHYFWWPGDALAERYRAVLAAALRCYFVSEANRRIAGNRSAVSCLVQSLFAILSTSDLMLRRYHRLSDERTS